MKIIHVINSLNKGGAEGNLYRLCKYQKNKYGHKINIIILTLIDNGFYEIYMKKFGIKVLTLGLKKNDSIFEIIKKFWIFRKIIFKLQPDVIQSWMYHSNLITFFSPRQFRQKIIWNIRHTKLSVNFSKKITIMISIICGILSWIIPKKIIYCSKQSSSFHEKNHFYSKYKTKFIENGFSDKTFFSSFQKRLLFRRKYKINDSDIMLGFAGRYTKEKNIKSLLIAFSKIIKKYDNVFLFLAGKDINNQNSELQFIIKKYNIDKKIFLLDEQKNLLDFYNGIDLFLLTSHTESFPNVIAESMLCETPVVTSDVGSASNIVGECGFVMDSNTFDSIFINLNKTIKIIINNKKKWNLLKKKCRLKIKQDYSLEKMSNLYMSNWVF